MIVIDDVAGYVPCDRRSNFDRQEEFGVDREFVVNKLGVEAVARKAANEETSDLCVRAFAALQAKAAVAPADVDCLVVCTQNPDADGIPHTSAVVHGKLGMGDDCACFDLSLGCSGYVYGLSVVTGFMEHAGLKTGLLFTADPYSKIIDPADRNTAMLFGDAATITLLRARDDAAGRWAPQRFTFATRGKAGEALHNRGRRLAMDGRAIFNFSLTEVPKQVRACLSATGLETDDVDLFLFHQGSRFIVENLIKRLQVSPHKVPIDLADHGNTVSSSIPLLLEKHGMRPGPRRIVLSGFGVGLSWATGLLTRDP